MKVVIVAKKGTIFERNSNMFQERLEQCTGDEVAWLSQAGEQTGNFMAELQAFAPDVLVTTDLTGFDQCTLTDNISYNLLNCKQIHLLLHENLSNEKYLEKQLSIAMFFFCVGDAYYDALKNKYPNLPYLKKLQGWQIRKDEQAMEKNVEILSAILQEVLVECGMASTT